MSLLFADIFEAIRTLRICKGTCEKDIMKYVQQKVGGCLSVGNVLKTISCLNKLVEEGVLIKKGERYLFPANKCCEPKPADDDDDCDEPEDDDCDDGDEGVLDECDQGCDEDEEDDDDDDDDDEEDDDDDDDDDEEEDEDDDDDDDDECDDKVAPLGDENARTKDAECENGDGSPAATKAKNGMDGKNGRDNVVNKDNMNNSANGKQMSDRKLVSTKKTNGSFGSGKFKKGSKTKPGIDRKGSCGQNKGGEAIAFCARDFIDSQCGPNPHGYEQGSPDTEQEPPLPDTDVNEKMDKVEKLYTARRKESRSKRSRLGNTCRSRSPIKRIKADLYHNLRMDKSDELGPDTIHSQIFQEPTDADMDIDMEKDADTHGVDYDLYRHRSPMGPPPPNTPGVHIDQKESCCSDFEKKLPSEVKIEQGSEGEFQYCLKKNIESRLSMMKAKSNRSSRKVGKDAGDKGKEKPRREISFEDEKTIKDEGRTSLCSVCEKKKRNS